MRKNILLFCNGLSGSGKTYFIENILPKTFRNLRSMTTRPQRPGEVDGEKYYFTTEEVFDTRPLATRLFVNEAFWQPGMPKWLYGVPTGEIEANLGYDMVYDVIQPRYTRQLIDWFERNNLGKQYDYQVAWFLAPENNGDIIRGRANMPNDLDVRRTNTCDAIDFLRAGVHVDYFVKSSATERIIPSRMQDMMRRAKEIPAYKLRRPDHVR